MLCSSYCPLKYNPNRLLLLLIKWCRYSFTVDQVKQVFIYCWSFETASQLYWSIEMVASNCWSIDTGPSNLLAKWNGIPNSGVDQVICLGNVLIIWNTHQKKFVDQMKHPIIMLIKWYIRVFDQVTWQIFDQVNTVIF